MSDETAWSELRRQGGDWIAPGLPQRVLAAAARHRAAVRDNLRVMVVATCSLSLLILAAIELDARTVAPTRLAQWDQVADWIQNFDN